MFKTQIIIIGLILLTTKFDQTNGQTNGQKKKCSPIKFNHLCHVPARDQSKITPTGLVAPNGYYPWYAAFYYTDPYKMVFTCAGSIISKTTILTVDTCVRKGRDELELKDLIVQVGSNKKYFGGQFFKVAFKTSEQNLVLIFLKNSITFTDTIRPVCFEINNPLKVLRSEQWVAGFDKNSRVGSQLQHQTLQPSEENQDCNVNSDVYGTCHPSSQGIKNCITASGTGLVYQIAGQWSIRGVATTRIYAQETQNFTSCDDLVWFTDVASNYDWIAKTLNSFKEDNLCKAPIMDDLKDLEVPFGYYPWHVSLFVDEPSRYQCGGSIISENLILTAARCFFNESKEIPSSHLYVEHGFGNKVSCYRVSSKIYPPLKDEIQDKFINNIGILRITESITFSDKIHPICLTSIPFKHFPQTEQWVVGANGNMTSLNHQLIVPSLDNEFCIDDNSNCFEDSEGVDTTIAHYGSGLVFKVARQWFLRGVAVVFSEPEIGCNKTLWIVDVSKHFDWIQNQIKNFI